MRQVPDVGKWVRWIGWFAAATAFILLTNAAAGTFPSRIAQNLPEDPPQIRNFCDANNSTMAEAVEAAPSALAIITARSWIGHGRMALEIRNLAPEEIRQVIFDAFTADANPVHFGWAVKETQPILIPQGGDASVQYPDPAGRGFGPAVISFEGLHPSDCAVFMSYLECWDHAGECPMLADLGGSRLEVVFAHSLRGTGELQNCPKHGYIFVKHSRLRRIPCEQGTSVAVILNDR